MEQADTSDGVVYETDEPILYAVADGVAWVTMNRPRFHNAQNSQMTYALDAAFRRAVDDAAVKVIVLGGEGRHFSAGHDIGTPGRDVARSFARAHLVPDHVDKPAAEFLYTREQEVYLGMCRRWRDIAKPTIAMVQGGCIAGGLMLAWVCDLIVAAEDAFFQDPVGRLMGIPGVEYFAHGFELPPRVAKEFLLLGERMPAERAYSFGMVNKLAPAAELRETTAAIAAKLAAQSSLGMWLTKQAVNQVEELRGKRSAMDAVFHMHHFAHAQNDLTTGSSIAGISGRSAARDNRGDGVSDPLATRLTAALGCRLPIIQTAMGWVAEPALVAATAEAGAFGFLGAAVYTPDEVAARIDAVRRLTARPFGVNFHMFQPGAEAIVALILANAGQVRAVSFGRGPDARMIGRFRDAGIRCVPTVGAVKHARKMAALGVDMLVVQGGEGGGHTGAVASTVLLPQVLDAVDLPVVAAGGFADGRGLAAALAYGADGVAMGTRFLLTRESPVPDAVKRRYLAAATTDIHVTANIDGLPQRMLANPALERIERSGPIGQWLRGAEAGLAMRRRTGASWRTLLAAARDMRSHGGLTLAQALRAAAAPTLIQRAMVDGDAERGLMATGQVAGRIGDLPSVAELVAAIECDARARIAALAGAPLSTKAAA